MPNIAVFYSNCLFIVQTNKNHKRKICESRKRLKDTCCEFHKPDLCKQNKSFHMGLWHTVMLHGAGKRLITRMDMHETVIAWNVSLRAFYSLPKLFAFSLLLLRYVSCSTISLAYIDPFQLWRHVTWFCELENKQQNTNQIWCQTWVSQWLFCLHSCWNVFVVFEYQPTPKLNENKRP